MFGKNRCFESFRKFFGVPFNQFELSNLPPVAILETDSAANVSCEWWNFLGKCVGTLKKDSTVDVLLEGFQNFSEQLFLSKH